MSLPSGRFGAEHPLSPSPRLSLGHPRASPEGCAGAGRLGVSPMCLCSPVHGAGGVVTARGAEGFAAGFGVPGHSPPQGAVPT